MFASLDSWLVRLTRFSARRSGSVVALALLLIAVCASYASRLELRGDFVELLPTDSPIAQRFRASVERKGRSSSTLIALVASKDAAQNQRFVQELERRLERLPPTLVGSIESGPQEIRDFYRRQRWLFADIADLVLIECELAHEREKRSPGYLGIDEPCSWPDAHRTASVPAKPAPAVERLERELNRRIAVLDRFPTGYYRNEDGTVYALLIRSPAAGMGEAQSDQLLDSVTGEAERLARQIPGIRLGFAGDIPNAVAERDALIDDITTVSLIAIGLILASVVAYFGSLAVLLHIGLAVAFGCGVAFATAMLVHGHLNAATSFLGSIIAGNGINYAIVYLARYRERRLAGDAQDAALVDAALTCRRGTWLAAAAASGAYAALMVTSFRGFSEFGLIGGVGMIACWAGAFVICPASVSLVSRLAGQGHECQARASRSLGGAFRSGLTALVSRLPARFPRAVLAAFTLLSVGAALQLPAYLSDPWEYNFGKLRSSSAAQRGAGYWSKQADRIFQTRGGAQLVLADDPANTDRLARQIVELDQKRGEKLVENVVTVYDRLGGTPDVVAKKLELLAAIRAHIDASLRFMPEREQRLATEWRPPNTLRALLPQDLPDILLDQFRETNGRIGTPIYVTLNPTLSLSRGENLLRVAELFEALRLPSGEVPPSASRATVFAAMIRAMERDGPRATAVAFLLVLAVVALITRRLGAWLAISGALACAVLLTVGGAALAGVRLNFLNFVALPLTFGIGVEYAINLYDRIQRCDADIVAGITSVGGAVFLCSLTTMIGYGTLLFADNQALQSFGAYAIAGELACILTAVLVLPAALMLMKHGRRKGVAGTGAAGRLSSSKPCNRLRELPK
jgi:hypothetical protein